MQYWGKIALAFLPVWDKKGGEQEERANCTDPSSGSDKNGILAKSESKSFRARRCIWSTGV